MRIAEIMAEGDVHALPTTTVSRVVLMNRHHNLYGNHEAAEGRLRRDGRVVIDGLLVEPGDSLYHEEGRYRRAPSPQARAEAERLLAPRIETVIAQSASINRTIARAGPAIPNKDDALFGLPSQPAWMAHRYPETTPNNYHALAWVDSVADTHDPAALARAVVDQYFNAHDRFEVGGYLQVPQAQPVTPALQQAIRAYHDRGGALGQSALDIFQHG